jgi:hypothetical protein
MLYPLSYGGARAQSSDLAFIRGGREWATFTHPFPGPRLADATVVGICRSARVRPRVRSGETPAGRR